MRDLLRTSKDLDALDARDRALAFRLAMGVAATQGLLDQMIDAHLRKPRSVEPKVRDALRVAAFELLWMQTPLQVAVSQGVELVRCARRALRAWQTPCSGVLPSRIAQGLTTPGFALRQRQPA
jgi:16S rRNA (cytosine967-C5)-methyltransferase